MASLLFKSFCRSFIFWWGVHTLYANENPSAIYLDTPKMYDNVSIMVIVLHLIFKLICKLSMDSDHWYAVTCALLHLFLIHHLFPQIFPLLNLFLLLHHYHLSLFLTQLYLFFLPHHYLFSLSLKTESFGGVEEDSVGNVSLEVLAGSPATLMTPSQILVLDDAMERMQQLARDIVANQRQKLGRDTAPSPENVAGLVSEDVGMSEAEGASAANEDGRGTTVNQATERLKETLLSLVDKDLN